MENSSPNPIPNVLDNSCHCEGGCLDDTCPCFLMGKMCGPNCSCTNCHNCEAYAEQRLAAIETKLLADPLAFTSERSLTPEKFEQICNFVMLTSSIDSEPFSVQPQTSKISKFVKPTIIKQAMVTVLSSPNELLRSNNPKSFEENVENTIASEFLDVIEKIQEYISKPNSENK